VTRRTRRPEWTDEDNAALTRAILAADCYRDKFGEPFGVWGFENHARALERALNEAIEAGTPLSEDAFRDRLGIPAPDPRALL
jgi:hypothetical protein